MKTYLLLLAITASALCSCGSKETVKPVSERIRQVWTVNVAKENSTTVYTKGATSNVKAGYSQFKLDLTQESTVRLTEIDNNTFVGAWALSSDNTKLTLSNLSPQPSATGGVLVYTIDGDPSETALNLILSSPNLKTGSASTRYELTR